MSRNPLIVAADVSFPDQAEGLAKQLSGLVAFMKVGLTLFTAAGPDVVSRMRVHGPVFLDLKLHDIPSQVRGAAGNAARLGVGLLTVHALGGTEMVAAAVEGSAEGAARAGVDGAPRVIAVTVLSSLAGEGLASPASLAYEAVSAGAAGVVVSGDDVAAVREALGTGPILVVPGIRPHRHGHNDQVRVLTPGEAIERGADYLVVGRPVTEAKDRVAAARAILREAGVE